MDRAKTLILGLGNPVRSDDGVGPRVVAELRRQGGIPDADLEDAGTAGLDILDLVNGYERLLIVDAIDVGEPPGTILELGLDDLATTCPRHAASSHEADLPTALELGRRLGLSMPSEIHIFAVQISDAATFSEVLTPQVEAAVAQACERLRVRA